MSEHNVFVNGRVYVRRRQCSTCIGKPAGKGRLLGISDERVAELVEGATGHEAGCVPCHAHLHEGADIEPVCAWFFREHATLALRLADALDVIEWVEP